MRKLFCCHKEAEESTESLQPTSQQPMQDPQGENDDILEENLFDDDEGLNLAWRNLLKSYEDGQNHDPYPGRKIIGSEIFQTLNFRNSNHLGRGNFGEVYRCDIPRLDKVGAAKVQKNQSEETHGEFLAEITTLHAANHPNVISLFGKCFHQDHRVIVYEFMPRGSLDHHLFPNMRPLWGRGRGILQEYKVFSLSMRLRNAVGVAKGLVYLPEELKMVHRDVKVSNVLLNKKFVPKLTDNRVEKRSEITLIKGTPGCTTPETEELGLVSNKNDFYSYGVSLFTGRKAFDSKRSSGKEKLADWLRIVCSRGDNTPLVVDSTMGNEKADSRDFEQTREKILQHSGKYKAGSGETQTKFCNQDICTSSTTFYVDSDGKLKDEFGFTVVCKGPRSVARPRIPSDVAEEVDVFVDGETMKFTSPDMVLYLRDQMIRRIAGMGDNKVKYKMGEIHPFLLYEDDDQITKAVESISRFLKRYRARRLLCRVCKKDKRNHRPKPPALLEHDMMIKMTQSAMKGRKRLVLISNDKFFNSTVANRLMETFEGLEIILPPQWITRMRPVPMYRDRGPHDVRPNIR